MKIIKKELKRLLSHFGYSIIANQNTSNEETKDLKIYNRIFSKDSLDNKRFYNVGSGSFYHPYWTSLDYVSEWYSGIQTKIIPIDLMKMGPLPIDSETAEIIYTSHTIEHITNEAVQNLCIEAFRCLKEGGIFRVTTGPDADTDYDAMIRGDYDWFYWDEWYDEIGTYEHIYFKPATSVPLEERWLHHVASQLCPNDISPSKVKLNLREIRELMNQKTKFELLDYLTSLCDFQPERTGNHISWWNYEKIESYLRAAGFNNIRKSGYLQSQSPVLRNPMYFDNTHPQISVYVEATK
jgi:hypothetical protein